MLNEFPVTARCRLKLTIVVVDNLTIHELQGFEEVLNIALTAIVGHSSQMNGILISTVVHVVITASIVHEAIIVRVIVEIVEPAEVVIKRGGHIVAAF